MFRTPSFWTRALNRPDAPIIPVVGDASALAPETSPRPQPHPYSPSAPVTSPRPQARRYPANAPATSPRPRARPVEEICETCPDCSLVTTAMLQQVFTAAPNDRLSVVADGTNYNINSGKIDNEFRMTHFFGQVLQEVGPAMHFRENLNYSAQALYNSRFSYYRGNWERSNRDARNEEAIANNAYADANRSPRFRLGNTEPGDGWRYRGRGLKQLTGRNNYRDFTTQHYEIWGENVDFEANPDLVSEPKYAVRSALYFWVANDLHFKADKGINRNAADSITAVINQATDSYEARWNNVNNIYENQVFRRVCFNTSLEKFNKDAAVPYGSNHIYGVQ